MAVWGHPTVARLALGEVSAGEFCGLVVNCSWPMPGEVVERYESFRKRLVEAMPPEAYVYPASTLHCTICTLRSFQRGPLDAALRERLVGLWKPVLEVAQGSDLWPKQPFRLHMETPTLQGSAGIFHFADPEGAIGRIRECIRAALMAAGGRAAEGGDWSMAKALPGLPLEEPAAHIPDIVHSTVLRWKDEPPDQEKAREAFVKVAEEAWGMPLELKVSQLRAVFEDVPYMHIPEDSDHIWWEA